MNGRSEVRNDLESPEFRRQVGRAVAALGFGSATGQGTAAILPFQGNTTIGEDGHTVHSAFYDLDNYDDPHAVYFDSGRRFDYGF